MKLAVFMIFSQPKLCQTYLYSKKRGVHPLMNAPLTETNPNLLGSTISTLISSRKILFLLHLLPHAGHSRPPRNFICVSAVAPVIVNVRVASGALHIPIQ
jgi:hypothetical protein